jgi:hypothetical protein
VLKLAVIDITFPLIALSHVYAIRKYSEIPSHFATYMVGNNIVWLPRVHMIPPITVYSTEQISPLSLHSFSLLPDLPDTAWI